MLTLVIEGYTDVLGAPAGLDPARHGACGSLPVRIVRDGSGRPLCCESAWEPTLDELNLLLNGGRVILRVVGHQVPVSLSVELPE